MSQDPEAIRRLTESYGALRGSAQSLPFALWFLVQHSAELAGVPFASLPFGTGAYLAIAATVGAVAMHRYYDRRFGVVTRPLRWWGGTLVLALVAFVALQVVSAYWTLPVQLGVLAIGIAVAAHALRHFELEGQHLLLAVIFIALSVSPLSIFDARDRESFSFQTGAVGIDVIWIIVALWDHRTLVRAFERVRRAHAGALSSSR